ncbi:MAG: glycosyltransferase family 1 protein [Parachlamydiaceae bacterium]|nr:MAG: glycosyltransferase family 1 protein [Parachlamydiaceae bacterium]
MHPPVLMEQSYSIIKQSKIYLNSMPFFKNGTHERIFLSFACGSLPITTDNLWVHDHFKQGEEILVYRSNHWAEADEMVNVFLADNIKREEIIRKGRKIVMENHTWDIRAQELLKQLKKIKT